MQVFFVTQGVFPVFVTLETAESPAPTALRPPRAVPCLSLQVGDGVALRDDLLALLSDGLA
jgi:hypothetical protein